MTGSPWWYSGDDEASSQDDRPRETTSETGDATSQTGESAGSRLGADWGALLSGAQRVVDWATETVMAPHSEHADPREHPQCLICRTLALLGENGPAAPTAKADAREATDATPATGIEWIPIREDPTAS
jgi:hypothetical protein